MVMVVMVMAVSVVRETLMAIMRTRNPNYWNNHDHHNHNGVAVNAAMVFSYVVVKCWLTITTIMVSLAR